MSFVMKSPCAVIAMLVLVSTVNSQAAAVEFNRDVRPILSDLCFQCHGPDKAKRKAKLHFDTEEGARSVIVAGKPQESELIRRITSSDPDTRMPPQASGHVLTPKQIKTITQWVAEGAKWQKHWSFIPPHAGLPPKVKNSTWPRSFIDHHVLARLEAEGLTPSPEADRVTLLRRVTLDLTGLPPTPAEVDAFLADSSLNAYEKAVDRLLKSPRYGEHLARHWLDAARYADTNGYQTDGERTMWRWRDWVIDAFNNNITFDRFTIEQIAGDLLPGATMRQKIATGFNRNHRGNSEGGVIPEEYAVEYVVDRVDTTATVWLGLSAGCAKCHSHKYDPISQKEFYQLYAYFNSVPEKGKAIKYGNSPPYIRTPTRDQALHLKMLESQLKAAEEHWASLQPQIEEAQAAWEKTADANATVQWTLRYGLQHSFRYGAPDPVWEDDDLLDVGDFGFFDKFSIGARIYPRDIRHATILSRKEPTDRGEGYELALVDGSLHVHLVKRWLDDAIRVHTVEKLHPDHFYHVLFTYDGSRQAKGVQIYIDGKPAQIEVDLDDLNQSFRTKQPFRVKPAPSYDDITIYDRVLDAEEVAIIGETHPIHAIVARPADQRTSAQKSKLRRYFVEQVAAPHIRHASAHRQAARRELEEYVAALPTTMVMEEMPTARQAHLLLRGEYDKPGDKVERGIPAALTPPAYAGGSPKTRLDLAVWLVSPENPLTPRVTVNRFWQLLFGQGIVRSVEDFGAQGEWPTHPELLDALAVEFRDGGWDVKKLLRTIVTSATYRQSSKLTAALKQRDPENRLLARGPRVRLSAEVIRDQALLASGLLVEKIGGPSVKPYQPPGLIKELHGTDEDVQDHGPSLYRRSLYTFWKRTVAPPGMTTFDAANRETCVVRQTRTNTPLQSLTLMNDVTFVEAARVLAERVMKAKATPEERLALAFRLVTARSPRPAELTLLVAALQRHEASYRARTADAIALISAGESPRHALLDPAEHAAYTAVANLLLNLDEVITKE